MTNIFHQVAPNIVAHNSGVQGADHAVNDDESQLNHVIVNFPGILLVRLDNRRHNLVKRELNQILRPLLMRGEHHADQRGNL